MILSLVLLSVVLFIFCIFFYLKYQRLALQLTSTQNTDTERLIADLSHELRTPLTSIKLQLYKLTLNNADQTKKNQQKLEQKVLEIERLLDELTQLSRCEIKGITSKSRSYNASHYFEQQVRDLTHFFNQHGVIFASYIELPLTLQVCLNNQLVSSLFKRLAENSVRHSKPTAEVHLRILSAKSHVVIEFEDTSPGVSEAELNNIFKGLYRVDKSRNRATGGAGFGLTICKRIVEAHDGTINAQPSHLGGLKIHIKLPCTESF
ncbi:hypothetical protein OM33_15035 [Pseudoalteromonas piratica]|uniref:histidine kinase n=1 Tax=Pseudoalteromonas piratica TaxID=1348114 RepID=A0A0A7EKG3_9GAMM|nr:hypothetical protein OM33_15035 [Pseudoalteromonas piratica]